MSPAYTRAYGDQMESKGLSGIVQINAKKRGLTFALWTT